MERLLALVERALGKEWVGIGEYLRSLPENQLAAIEARLLAFDYTGIIAQVDEAARTFAAATQAEFARAGRAGAAWLDEQPALTDKLIRFDAANDRAVRAARRNELELVQGLTQETRETITQVIVDGQRVGLNPRAIAQDIRDSITLTPHQAKHVTNYRRALEQRDYGNALGRELRDARSDRTLARLQRDGGSLPPAKVDALVERYRANYVTYRAEVIARTESAKNVAAGLSEAYTQAVERGDVEAGQLTKEWIPGPRTKHARAMHRASSLLEQRPKVNEAFVLGDGVRMAYPGDPNAPVEHLANCRCTWATTLDVSTDNASAAAPTAPPKNPRRQAAARTAAAASVERRREIHSAAKANLPQELHSTWDKEGHKFMREEAARIRGVKDRVNASSTLSQAFAEKYGSGAETVFGNEGDRFHRRAEIEAAHAESWANEQERKYYAEMQRAQTNTDDDDPPF